LIVTRRTHAAGASKSGDAIPTFQGPGEGLVGDLFGAGRVHPDGEGQPVGTGVFGTVEAHELVLIVFGQVWVPHPRSTPDPSRPHQPHLRDVKPDPAFILDMADYPMPEQLPSLKLYLRKRYGGELSASDVRAIADYADSIAGKRGVSLDGPAPGEDEQPERATTRRTASRTTKPTKKPTTKGGTS
jgi:hypothetical protein